MKNNTELYEDLGISKDASADEIKKAYRDSAKKHHPDKNDGKESPEFVRASKAYNILKDESKRTQYDSTGEYDAQPFNVRQHALQNIASLFTQIISDKNYRYETVDLFKTMIENMNLALQNNDGKLQAISKQRARFELINERISGADSMFNDMIKSTLAQNESALKTVEQDIEVLQEAKSIIKKYEYRIDEIQELDFIISTGPQMRANDSDLSDFWEKYSKRE